MDNQLARNLATRDELSATERAVLDAMIEDTRTIPARSDFVQEGDRPKSSSVMLSGLSARYNLVADGKRHISAVHVPGDFVDLHGLLLEPIDHSVTALTECTIALVPHERLREVTRTEPHLTRLLWLLTVVDAAIFRQWLVAAARLPAEHRLARFFCELYTRLEAVGLASDHRFELPITQTDLGDAMGLSLVHVNKSLQKMRQLGLLRWQGGRLEILDWNRMCSAADFDPTYLNYVRTRR